MAQQPAVVIIARHGARLDGADQSWHLSTPTPYDPPLTYGGWNQCRALGTRIASLLHAREKEVEIAHESGAGEGVADGAQERSRKRKRRQHRVVIHSSPFLRCLQTSVAIAAGLGQYAPGVQTANRQASGRKKTTEARKNRDVATEGVGAPEHKNDLVHSLARKTIHEHTRARRATIRIDSFLGEWLNPQYYENILPPPPSPMMMATAKAELMQNDPVDTFVPTAPVRMSGGSLWGGSGGGGGSSAFDDWTHIRDQLPARKRDRASSQSSVESSGSASGRKSHHRYGAHVASKMPKPEFSIYRPPVPHYAVSSASVIPRGYVAHARNACANVDYHWDSSRAPLLWGDGGEYGEEWSALHKRFRRGLNHMIEWYSRHNADDRSEDALGLDQAEKHAEEEGEELVVILVTHGAGCNALIGALTGQPVLLDVGMASLTMAVRKDNPPPMITYASSTAPSLGNTPRHSPAPESTYSRARRGSLDLGLSSVYDMKLISSSEHLRPRSDARRPSSPRSSSGVAHGRNSSTQLRPSFDTSAPSNEGSAVDSSQPPGRGSMSAALGSIRRPSTANAVSYHSLPMLSASRSNSIAFGESILPPTAPGLWSPPSRAHATVPQEVSTEPTIPAPAAPHSQTQGISGLSSASDKVSLHSDVPASSVAVPPTVHGPGEGARFLPSTTGADPTLARVDGALNELRSVGSNDEDVVGELQQRSGNIPSSLNRGPAQRGLWGPKPSGDQLSSAVRDQPKRRWTVTEDK